MLERAAELRAALIQARRELDALIDNTGEYTGPEHDRLQALIKELRHELFGILED